MKARIVQNGTGFLFSAKVKGKKYRGYIKRKSVLLNAPTRVLLRRIRRKRFQ